MFIFSFGDAGIVLHIFLSLLKKLGSRSFFFGGFTSNKSLFFAYVDFKICVGSTAEVVFDVVSTFNGELSEL